MSIAEKKQRILIKGGTAPTSYALSENVSTASVMTGGSTGYSGLKEANRPGALLAPALD
jgi:hypothetical protein